MCVQTRFRPIWQLLDWYIPWKHDLLSHEATPAPLQRTGDRVFLSPLQLVEISWIHPEYTLMSFDTPGYALIIFIYIHLLSSFPVLARIGLNSFPASDLALGTPTEGTWWFELSLLEKINQSWIPTRASTTSQKFCWGRPGQCSQVLTVSAMRKLATMWEFLQGSLTFLAVDLPDSNEKLSDLSKRIQLTWRGWDG